MRRGFEHLIATGEPAWDALHEQIEIRDHDIMDGSEYRGHADVRRWLFEDWSDAWAEWSAEPEEYIAAGEDRVIAVFRITATGRNSGVRIERHDAIVYVVHDLQVTRIDYYNSKQQALEAAGLAE